MAQSAFAKAFVNKAKKTFQEAKKFKHREGNSFGPVPVPDGTYTAVVTLETSVPAKGKMEGIPIVRVKAAISEGKYTGLEPSKSFFCEGKPIPSDPQEPPTAEQEVVGLLAWLLPDMDISEVEQVPDAIALVNERGPLCLVGVRNTTNKDTKKEYQNIYLNKLLKGSTFESAEAEAVTESDSGEGTEDGSSEPEPDYVPAKGDIVTLEGKDEEWEITAVSQARKTVNVRDTADESTRINGVAWADCLLV